MQVEAVAVILQVEAVVEQPAQVAAEQAKLLMAAPVILEQMV
jgi:hypothetical protein